MLFAQIDASSFQSGNKMSFLRGGALFLNKTQTAHMKAALTFAIRLHLLLFSLLPWYKSLQKKKKGINHLPLGCEHTPMPANHFQIQIFKKIIKGC